MSKTTTCKRCGSTQVAWVQSKKTGKWYLAFTTAYHGDPGDYASGRRGSSGGTTVHKHIAHDCDDPIKGGHSICETCGQRHQRGAQSICDANTYHARKAAEADSAPEWQSWIGPTGTEIHALESADYDFRVRTLPSGMIELEWQLRRVPQGSSLKRFGDEDEFATVEEAKVRAAEIVAELAPIL